MYRKLIKKFANQKAFGFTITEVAVASGLLIIAMVPILHALTTANTNVTIIEQRTQSLTLAQTKLNEIKARSIYSYAGNFDENNSVLYGSYLCNVTDTPQTTNLRSIAISVGYDQNASSTLEDGEVEVTLTTYLARRW